MWLLALIGGFFPRFAVLIIWIARPGLFTAAFSGVWIWPLLGLITLPFTTLIYTVLWAPNGLSGWDWLWLGLAVLLDISHVGGVGYSRRQTVPITGQIKY